MYVVNSTSADLNNLPITCYSYLNEIKFWTWEIVIRQAHKIFKYNNLKYNETIKFVILINERVFKNFFYQSLQIMIKKPNNYLFGMQWSKKWYMHVHMQQFVLACVSFFGLSAMGSYTSTTNVHLSALKLSL